MMSNFNFSKSYNIWANLVDSKLLPYVPQHWLQFPQPDPKLQYILGALYIVIMLLGLFGNVCLISLFLSTKHLRSPSNCLVVNLALCDSLILSKMPIFIYNSFSLGPAAGFGWCQYYAFIGGLSGTAAIMTISAIAYERYMTISRPLDPFNQMSHRKVLFIAMCIWMYALSFSVVPLLGINRFVPEGFLTSCSFDYLSDETSSKIFILVFFIAAWCVPMTIITGSYIGIFMYVKSSQKHFVKQAEKMKMIIRNVEKQRQTEIKLAKVTFCLVSFWTLSWTPYAVVALLGLFTDRSCLTPLSAMIPALFCKTASVLDPFVYGLTNPGFKMQFRKKVRKLLLLKNAQRVPMTSFKMKSIQDDFETSVDDADDQQDDNNSPDNFPRAEKLPSTSVSINTEAKSSDTGEQAMRRHSVEKDILHNRQISVFVIPNIRAMVAEDDKIKISIRRSF